jgi:hypothetical protein
MTDDTKLWLPWMLTMLSNVIVVTFTAWLNARSVHAMIAELRQAVRADIAELREELKLTHLPLTAQARYASQGAQVPGCGHLACGIGE